MLMNTISKIICLFAVLAIVLPLVIGEDGAIECASKVPPPPPEMWIKQVEMGKYLFLSGEAKNFVDKIEKGILEKGGRLGEVAILTRKVPFRPVRLEIEEAFKDPDIRQAISKLPKSKIAAVLEQVSSYLSHIAPGDVDEIEFAKNKWARELGVEAKELVLAK